MKLAGVWTTIVYVFDVLTFRSTDLDDKLKLQKPLLPDIDDISKIDDNIYRPVHPHVGTAGVTVKNWEHARDDGQSYSLEDGTPIIPVSRNAQEGAKALSCQYPQMQGWQSCHGPNNRGCWLYNGNNVIDITTDYENPNMIPKGIVRKFYLEVGEEPIFPDRKVFEHAKLFNRTYPGPWIEACWGDTIEVTVKNLLRWNGTSIHWHGFRQLGTSHMDGVNGVTECPIAPGDTFTYRFTAMQYGSAWYHSHYGLQYGDGLLGPITIHGPSTANFDEDEAFKPILMTDWNHRSVFEEWPFELITGNAPQMTNILLNGKGQFGPGATIDDKYQLQLTPGKRHKLILINTSVDTIFVFSIDNHEMTIIEMDFVPIKPYKTNSIRIGIGQRYHVIVAGKGDPYLQERFGNYWIRTTPARYCSKFAYPPDEQSGIIRYDPTMDRNASALSEPEIPDNLHCSDEDHKKLIPYMGWRIGNPVNIDPRVNPDTLPPNRNYIFDVAMMNSSKLPYYPSDWRYRWAMHEAPFRINFSDPTILGLDRLDGMIKDRPYLDIVTYGDNVEDQWIWMVLTGAAMPFPSPGRQRQFFPASHPMHLHGHDFAILYQTEYPWYDDPPDAHHPRAGFFRQFTPDKLNCQNPYINCINPARRDVVMLPAGGFVIMAFKADNPGAWIFHCHIAFHASSGLAMQIVENRRKISFPNNDLAAVKQRCKNWDDWFNNPDNHWDKDHPEEFQDDSGV